MLTRLRDAFNDPLFIRAPHGMVPTLRAQALAAPVKQLLIDAETLLQPARSSSRWKPILPGPSPRRIMR